MADSSTGLPMASLPDRSTSSVPKTKNTNRPNSAMSDSAMREAIETYKKQMYDSNKKFINDRIDEISAMDLSDKEKLDVIAPFWFSKIQSEWPAPEDISEDDEQGQREKNITTIEEMSHFEIRQSEGLIAATVGSKECIEKFIGELEQLMNDKAGLGIEKRITFPEEVNILLQFANGVRDVDIRDQGICEWDLVSADFESLVVDSKMRKEQMMRIEQQLRVKTGILTGGPKGPEFGGYYWYSYYLFCKRISKDDEHALGDDGGKTESYEQADGWGWKIVFECTSDDYENLMSDLPIFDTIPEFLTWYSTWEKREREEGDLLKKVQETYAESGLCEDLE